MCPAEVRVTARPFSPLYLLQENTATHVEAQGEWDEMQGNRFWIPRELSNWLWTRCGLLFRRLNVVASLWQDCNNYKEEIRGDSLYCRCSLSCHSTSVLMREPARDGLANGTSIRLEGSAYGSAIDQNFALALELMSRVFSRTTPAATFRRVVTGRYDQAFRKATGEP